MKHKNKILSKEQILQKALETTQIGLWYWYVGDEGIIANDAFLNLTGLKIANGKPIPVQDFISICHIDDQKILAEKLTNYNQNSSKQFGISIRLNQKNEQWHWVQFSGEIAETDPLGSPIAFTGVLTGISEQHRSKDSIQYRYEIEKLVSDISSDFVGVQMNNLDKTINQSLKKNWEFHGG